MIALGILAESFPAPVYKVSAEDAQRNAAELAGRVPGGLQGGQDQAHERQAYEDTPGGAVKPTRVLTARQVPVHLQAAAMDTLKKVIDSGVIVP
jgi:transposase